MHVLRTALLSGVILTTAWTPAAADEQVTAMLRNGERVTGRFDGFTNGLVYIDVSATDERKIPVGDVALLDLVGGAQGLPETELSQARGGQHLLLPKSGGPVKGQLVTIEGSERDKNNPRPTTVVFRTESGEERRIALREVGRLYLGNFPGQPAAGGGGATAGPETAASPGVVRVQANQKWVDTGLALTEGQQLTLESSGTVKLNADGSETSPVTGTQSGRKAAGAHAPDLPVGALVGRLGNGQAFGIGSSTSLTMPASGRLYLAVNDDENGDNQGYYDVRLTPGAAPAGPRRRR
jgi:hypothetical protein